MWVQVKTKVKTVSVTKACAAAGDYAAEDVLSESASAGTTWLFSDVVDENGRAGCIVKAQAICETTALTPKLVLFLFNAAPTCETDDNKANTALVHADLAKYVGRIDFPAMADIGGDSESTAALNTAGNLPIYFECSGIANDLYGVVATIDAITGEAATQDLTIILTVEQST